MRLSVNDVLSFHHLLFQTRPYGPAGDAGCSTDVESVRWN